VALRPNIIIQGTEIWTKHIGPIQVNVLLLFGFSIMAIATIFTKSVFKYFNVGSHV